MLNIKVLEALITKAKAKLRIIMSSIDTRKLWQIRIKRKMMHRIHKKHITDNTPSIYDKFEEELREIYDNEAKTLGFNNLVLSFNSTCMDIQYHSSQTK